MAFFYRGATSPRDEPTAPSYTSPLSPQRNLNRLSGSMMPSSVSNDVRAGMTRRFTTNALPTLSPIGQQRKQAAGDYAVSTAVVSFDAPEPALRKDSLDLDTSMVVLAREDVTPSPRRVSGLGGDPLSPLVAGGFGHRRNKSCWGAIGDGRPNMQDMAHDGKEPAVAEEGEGVSLGSTIYRHRLTNSEQPAGYVRKNPVSLLFSLCCRHCVVCSF